MRRLATFTLIVISLVLISVPLVAACEPCPECADTIKVIPVGATENGGPLVTTSPANLMILHTGQGPIKNVWLLIVLNTPTYDVLGEIKINGTTFMTKSDFKLVTTQKIPPIAANSTTGYPGSSCQYNSNATRDKMGETANPIYYGIKFFLPKITTQAQNFTVTVELTGPADLKALILALGRYDWNNNYSFGSSAETDCICYKPFNRCSSFSKSTLVVPELATLLTTASTFSALGLFAIRRRKN